MSIKKRAGITLTEVLVMMVLMSIFLVAVFQTFNVIQTTIQTNRIIVDRLYLEANIENFFAIMYDELRWGGSMTDYLKDDPDRVLRVSGTPFTFSATSLYATSTTIASKLNAATLTTHYAGAEKVILKRLSSYDNFPHFPSENPATQSSVEVLIPTKPYVNDDEDKYFFALFLADIPILGSPPRHERWIIRNDDLFGASDTTIQRIAYETFPADVPTVQGTTEPGTAVYINQSPLSNYIFVSLFEGPDDFKGLSIPDRGIYHGEAIAETTFFWNAQAKLLQMQKYIPTVSPDHKDTITLNLLDRVTLFDPVLIHAQARRRILEVKVVCSIPHPYDPAKAKMVIEKTRRFWFWEGQ